MSASDHLNGIQFHASVYDHNEDVPSIEAHIDGQRAGYLAYQPHEGTLHVNDMSVEPAFQRRGVASGLMDEMLRRHPGHDVDHGERTNVGSAWYEGYKRKGGRG